MTLLTLTLAESKTRTTLPSFSSSSPQFVQDTISIVLNEIQEAMDQNQAVPITFDPDPSLVNGMITLPCWFGNP